MDDVSYQKLQQYQQALKALQRSVERSLQEGTFEGTGKMGVKSYQGIQRKVAELFPEDFYITETLALESEGDMQERHMVSQVQLAASQKIIYLDGLLREYRQSSGVATGEWGDLKSWGRDFGRDLQQQIIDLTRTTIRRAVEGIDIDVQGGESLRGADMEGAHLEGANFSGRNLKDANLENADLRNANFTGANLSGANLEGANAAGANFSGANLKDANLEGVDFSNANLTGANCKGANLERANLTEARIVGANFKDATLKGATMPKGQEYRNEGDLFAYGASARGSSTGQHHVRIEITRDEEDEKPKNDDDKPKNDDDLV